MAAASETSAKRRFPWWGVLAVLALGVAGAYVFAVQQVDKEFVEERLKTFSDTFNASAHAQGYGMKFTYKSVETAGGLFSRHAVIIEPSVEFSDANGQSKVSTPRVSVHPASLTMRRLRYVLPDAVKMEEKNGDVFVLSSVSPLAFEIEQQISGDKLAYEYEADLSTTLNAMQKAGGVETQYRITLASDHTFRGRIGDFGEQSISLVADDIKVKEAEKDVFSLAHLTFITADKPLEGNKHDVTYNVQIRDLNLPAMAQTYGATTFVADMHYVGAPLTGPAGQMAAMAQEDAQLQVRDFALSSKDVSIAIKGELNKVKEEVVPLGTLTLDIKNFPFLVQELQKQGFLKQQSTLDILHAVIQKTTGEDFNAVKDLRLDFKHERARPVYVGKATGEDLVSIFMDAMLKEQQSRQPVGSGEAAPTPPAEK